MNNQPIVVLDACVLYPATLRNLLMWLAVNDLFSPKWSEQIHDEWIRNVLSNRPDLKRSQLERTPQLMDQQHEPANHSIPKSGLKITEPSI